MNARLAAAGLLAPLLAANLAGGCKRSSSSAETEGSSQKEEAEPAEADESSEAGGDDGWTRAEWLEAAEGFAENPATMPRLGDPKTRARFQELVQTQAWLEIDQGSFGRDEELLRFFPTIKKLSVTLSSLAAMDELVALSLYTLDVYEKMLEAGMAFVERLPASDTSKKVRLGGLDKMRLGAAITVCGLLYLALDASADYRAATFARLTRATSYSYHSREGLQLILATLENRLLKSGPPQMRERYQSIRELVAAEYAGREPKATGRRVIYEDIGPPGLDLTEVETVVSSTGEFTVDICPAALVKRVEERLPDGSTSTQHWIEWRSGETRFEAVCVDGETETTLAETFGQMPGLVAHKSDKPGRWFVIDKSGLEGMMRIASIAGRGCLASVEGPAGKVLESVVERFLLSLRAAR